MDSALDSRFNTLLYVLKTSQSTLNSLLGLSTHSGELVISDATRIIEDGLEVIDYSSRVGEKFVDVFSENGLGFHKIKSPVNC